MIARARFTASVRSRRYHPLWPMRWRESSTYARRAPQGALFLSKPAVVAFAFPGRSAARQRCAADPGSSFKKRGPGSAMRHKSAAPRPGHDA